MSEAFLGEIRLMSFGFAPKGWAQCNGQLLPIDQNQALFSLLGTVYGGDGKVNFGLPDLQGRVPISMDGGHTLGERGGEQAHTLSIPELPTHVHTLNGTSSHGTQVVPAGNLLARTAPANPYVAPSQLGAMNAASIPSVGGSQAHTNMQPFLAVTFCIMLQGIFPSQN
jgi:microcystin-dependent protein